MLLGPIFQVELVSTSRRGRYFALRVLYGLLILLVLYTCYVNTRMMRTAFTANNSGNMPIRAASELAGAFFYGFSWLQLLAIIAIGPAMAVGTIASERERRTIEYLFTTDLSNLEIVGSKTLARLLLIGKLVLVSLPILFLFRLLGGIPADALMSVFLLSASTALFVTSLGIFVSVWSPRSRDGVIRVYLLMFALFVLPFILYGFGMSPVGRYSFWRYAVAPVVEAVLKINPLWVLQRALGNRAALGVGLDFTSVLDSAFLHVFLSILLIATATFAVRRVHLGRSSKGVKKLSLVQSLQWKPALGSWPMIWKEMFAGTARTQIGLVGFICVALILATVFGLTTFIFFDSLSRSYTDSFIEYTAMMTGLMGSGILLLLAARASGLVTNEIERDCWVSLLATPLSGREIIGGKVWGNLYSIRWGMVAMAFIWGFGLVLDPGYILGIALTLATFAVMAFYVTNLGIFFSLRSKTSLRAMGSTLGTLLFTSGGYFLCCCTVMMNSRGDLEEIILAPCIPFLLVFPTVAYESMTDNRGWSGPEDELVVGYVIGMILYVFVGGILFLTTTERFDHFAGRTTSASSGE